MDDLEFGRRLMGSPLAGLAWASEIFSQAREGLASANDVKTALWCVERPLGKAPWPQEAWRPLHNARLRALRAPGQEGLVEKLTALWIHEEQAAPERALAGMAAWVDTIANGASHGVEPSARSQLARAAVESEHARSWMSKKTPEALASMLEELCESSAGAEARLTCLLAAALPPRQALRVLSKACFGNTSATRKVRGLDPLAARRLAETALTDPVVAHELLHAAMFSNISSTVGSVHDPLAGVFQALADNPRPALAPSANIVVVRTGDVPQIKNPAKVLLSGVGALSLAAQLLCDDRAEAGLAAAAWAAGLGAAGRRPQNWRSDGVGFEAKFNMEVRVARVEQENSYRRCSVAVWDLRCVAVALRDEKMLVELARLGWGWPKKGLIRRVGQDVQKAIDSVKNSTARPLWRGQGDPTQARSGVLAFAEACELRRVRLAPQATSKRPLRM